MAIKSYQDLTVWQRAMDLVEGVYRVTKDWPKDEQYGLVNQVRRAVVSVPANIAEGQGRTSDRGFARFLAIAHGSLYEVETHLLIALRLGYGDAKMIPIPTEQAAEVRRSLRGLQRTIQTSIAANS